MSIAGGEWFEVSLRGENGGLRAPGHIVDEVRALPRRGWIAFVGDELGRRPAHARLLIRGLRPLGRRWAASVHPELFAAPDLLPAARRSGCRALVFGPGWDPARRLARPGGRAARGSEQDESSRLIRILRRVRAAGIVSILHLVFGYDEDDEGLFERVVRFCRQARVGLPRLQFLAPRPGSELYDRLEREGRLLTADPAAFDGERIVVKPALMEPRTLENGLRWARRALYGHASIWRRCFSLDPVAPVALALNYGERRRVRREPGGRYTPTMHCLRRFSRPIRVRERGTFISTLVEAIESGRERLQGRWLGTQAVRDEQRRALVVRLEGVLDARAARALLARLRAALKRGQERVILDLAGLEAVSLTVLTRFLRDNAERLAELRGRIALVNLRPVLAAARRNLGGKLPNQELLEAGLLVEAPARS